MKTTISTVSPTFSSSRRKYLPEDPFNCYFDKNSRYFLKGLLGIPRAQQWFDNIEWGYKSGFYVFQQALESKSGPRVHVGGQEFLMISSYDYLGLLGHPLIEQAATEAIQKYGTGTGGVRLLTGTTDLHRRFEADLATFKGSQATVTFSSGYMANLAVISSLFGPRDRVIIDSRAHRSVIDACMLARVPMQKFNHNDPSSLRRILDKKPCHRTLIVVEGIYSMDGDICPLPEIIDLKRRYSAYLMVDEAHSFGVLGSTGRGVDEYFGSKTDDIDIWMGSLSKAIPSNGGFIAGSEDLIIYLQHASAPYMFSAALCPSAIASARESLRILQAEPERLIKLHRNADFLRTHLMDLGYNVGKSASPIIPIIIGDYKAACAFAGALFGIGIIATPVIYPAVPRRSGRLRLCVTAGQDEEFLQEILDGFLRIRSKITLPERFMR